MPKAHPAERPHTARLRVFSLSALWFHLWNRDRYMGQTTWSSSEEVLASARLCRSSEQSRTQRGNNDASTKRCTAVPMGYGEYPACDEGMELARRFLEAAGECVSTLGQGRTSTSRSDLLWSYNAMVNHSDRCDKCNEV
jgi:hypothetical protein